MENEEVLQRTKEDRNIPDTIKEGRVTGLVIFGLGNAFWSTLLKER